MKKSLLLLVVMLATSMGLLAQGSSWQDAVLINNGDTLGGTWGYVIWYKFIVPEEGTINLTVKSYDGLTFRNEVYGFKNGNVYIRGYAPYGSTSIYQAGNAGIGVYYIMLKLDNASPRVGTYQLTYTFTPCPQANDPEPNDDYQHASMLYSGNTVEGRLAYRTSDDVTDLEDWYMIDVPEEGQINFTLTGYNGLLCQDCAVYGYKNGDIYSRGVFTYAGATSTYQAKNAGVGVYYVKIKRQTTSTSNGGYELTYTFTTCPQANDPEPNDDYQHASMLYSDNTVQGRLAYRTSDDVTDLEDWYMINVPEEGQIDFALVGYDGLLCQDCAVYGYKNGDIYSRGVFSYSGSTSTYQAKNAGVGVYYVKIKRQTTSTSNGGYELTYTFTPCPLSNDAEPNEDYEHAAWLPSGLTQKGRLGYRTSDDITDTEDWYRFTVTKKGSIELIVIGTENLKFGNCSVYGLRDNGTIYSLGIFSGYDTDTETYQADDIEKGTYYVKIPRKSGAGGYRLTYNGPTKSGDVDGSGRLSIDDVTALINYLLTDDATGIDLEAANCNGDDYVNIADVTDLINILLTY